MKEEILSQTFMVIDFETVTPKGISPEPIQLGLVQIDNLKIDNTKQKSWFMKPPTFAPLTTFDTEQTGITKKDLENAKSADEIFNIVEKICGKQNYIFIAQNANYEMGICKRFYKDRTQLAEAKFIDTIKLSKLAFPSEQTYKLDAMAKKFNIDIPSTRHTALTDCIITGKLFLKLIEKLNITKTNELLKKACINNTPIYTQLSLFNMENKNV